VGHGLTNVSVGPASFRFILAANVGSVIMPWMIFYQQGAVIQKRVRQVDLTASSWDTLFGSVVTQAIMIAVVIATAATIGAAHPGVPLPTIGSIARALSPFFGWNLARIVFGLGLAGAAFLAALVISLAASWGVSEAANLRHGLDDRVSEARGFYWLFAGGIAIAGVVVVGTGSLVKLSIDVEIMNAMLLPVVLGFLLLLEARALPARYRMRGFRRHAVWTMSGLIIAFGLYPTVATLLLIR
jgi:Mn2+/Fe2+ NRAMP family transporter